MSTFAIASSIPSGFSFGFSTCFSSLQAYPWVTLARHFSALLIYGLAFAQWPTYRYHHQTNDLNRGYSLSTATFTLVFWCACFFHYAISAGRVDVDWTNGRFVARGWLVRNSRKSHRAILVLALAVSSATVIQTSTVHWILFMDHLAASVNQTDDIIQSTSRLTTINLLKTDFGLAIVFSIYLGVRLCIEPTGLLKRRRRRGDVLLERQSSSTSAERRNDNRQISSSMAVRIEHAESNRKQAMNNSNNASEQCKCPVPDQAEECQICVQRIANRQLNCGHLMCCCCIIDLFKHATGPLPSLFCPFCRRAIYCARELKLIVSRDNVPLTECCSFEKHETIP